MGLSVVLTVYNRPSALNRVLCYLQRQNTPPDQVIVVDDSSRIDQAEKQAWLAMRAGAEYIYFQKSPKLFRRAACNRLGLARVEENFVAFLGVDNIFDANYTFSCCRVLEQYNDIVVFHRLEFIGEQVYTDCCLGRDRMVPDGKYPVLGGWTGKEEYWSTIDDVRPSYWAAVCDGHIFARSEQIRAIDAWDQNIVGWGRENNDFAVTCLLKGLTCVALWDVVAYHIDHDREYDMYRLGGADLAEYMEKKWKNVKYPPHNGLRRETWIVP